MCLAITFSHYEGSSYSLCCYDFITHHTYDICHLSKYPLSDPFRHIKNTMKKTPHQKVSHLSNSCYLFSYCVYKIAVYHQHKIQKCKQDVFKNLIHTGGDWNAAFSLFTQEIPLKTKQLLPHNNTHKRIPKHCHLQSDICWFSGTFLFSMGQVTLSCTRTRTAV